MEPAEGLPPDLRAEIDAVHPGLARTTHYELLGVERSADRPTVLNAHTRRVRRLLAVPAGLVPHDYRAKIEAIVRALDQASTVLTDPIQRFRYDQQLLAESHERGGSVRPQSSQVLSRAERAQEVWTRTPSAEHHPVPGSHGSEGGHAAVVIPPSRVPSGMTSGVTEGHRPPHPSSSVPEAIHPRSAINTPRPETPAEGPRLGSPPSSSNLIVPPPLRRNPTGTAPRMPPPRSEPPPRFDSPPRSETPSRSEAPPRSDTPAQSVRLPSSPAPAQGLEGRLTALEGQFAELAGEFGTLLADTERLTASVQICLTHLSDSDGPRRDQMIGAFQALVGTRATLATMMARREELAGRWDSAAMLWQRAARARPNDAMLLVRAADALRHAGNDLGAAEMLARQAVELAPDLAVAHATLAVIMARR